MCDSYRLSFLSNKTMVKRGHGHHFVLLCLTVIFLSRQENQIRYPLRKARADVRKRVKGRFVKAEDYDSDTADVT